MQCDSRLSWVAGLGLALTPLAVSAAPTYSVGQTGIFGLQESYHWFTPNTMNSTDDTFTVRFSALDNQTIDKVRLRLDGGGAGTTWRIGVQADDGSGNPTGTYLASTVHSNATAIAWNPLSIGGSVALTAGNTYHIVAKPETLGAGETVTIWGGNSNNAFRPYDHGGDNKMTFMRSLDGGAWQDYDTDPYFVLYNGAATVQGPGQAYINTVYTGNYTRGGNAQAWGQLFSITDKEVPSGAQVQMSQIHFGVHSTEGAPDDNLLIRLRQTDGTVLATAQLTPAQAATGNFFDLNFDVTATLTQGVNYLMTTEFGGDGGTSDHYYKLYTKNIYASADADATWGGQVFEPVYKSIGGSWTAWEDPGLWDRDIPFTLTGTVVPEPAAGILLVGSLAMLARRRAH